MVEEDQSYLVMLKSMIEEHQSCPMHHFTWNKTLPLWS